jgi:hypothetical protein
MCFVRKTTEIQLVVLLLLVSTRGWTQVFPLVRHIFYHLKHTPTLFALVILETGCQFFAQADLILNPPILSFPLSLAWQVCTTAHFSIEMVSSKLFSPGQHLAVIFRISASWVARMPWTYPVKWFLRWLFLLLRCTVTSVIF